MDAATQSHLTQIRHLLLFRMKELRAEIHACEMARRLADHAADAETKDRQEEAWQDQMAELKRAEEQRDVAEFAHVEAALRRLDSGVYGDCTDCGEPIPLARLLVQPEAWRCAACQAKSERGAAVRPAGLE